MTAPRIQLALLALGAALAACASPIVGAECRPGFVRCDGACVDVEKDPAHCGECGHDCGRLECRKASCGPGPRPDLDGGNFTPGDAGSRDGGKLGPGITPGSVGNPFTPDGGLTFPDPTVGQGCALGEIDCGGDCADLAIASLHCGDCATACPRDQFCSAGMCKDACTAPLELCEGNCVDFQTSTSNCGVCNHVCASGICEAGVCEDVIPGQLVVFGHDYQTPRMQSATMKRLAGNAVFLAKGSPVRALVYRGRATEPSMIGVTQAIDYVVGLDGRQWVQTDAIEEEVPSQLYGADAFIIHAQSGATDAILKDLGQRWGLAISQFLFRGGVVLLFETVSSTNSGTYHLLEPAGLFSAGSREGIDQTLTIVSPGSAVATRTTRNYRSAKYTVHFLDVTSPGTVVVEDRDGEAVIVHRVITL